MICTTAGCGAPSDLYLCTPCIRDLQAWIDKVPEVRAELFTTMAKLDNTAGVRGEGGNGMTKEMPLPIREGAMELRHALKLWQGQDAQRLANDPHAAGYQPMLIGMLNKADRIMDIPGEKFAFGTCRATTDDIECQATLSGPKESATIQCPDCGTEHDIEARRNELHAQAKGEPLPPREAREYLAKRTGTHIKTKDFENWVQNKNLGYVLDRVTTEGKPKRLYFPGSLFIVYHQMMDRRQLDKKLIP